MKKIPIAIPYFDNAEEQAVIRVLRSGWIVQGPETAKLEQLFCDYTGAKYAVATNSCTSCQFIASHAIGLKPGDEVIVPAFTWISTANCVEFTGAKPVFADIDLATWNIDPADVAERLSPKTKALYPVNLFGLPADLPRLNQMAKKNKLRLIEDCACSLGGFIKGKHSGLFGEAGCFSLHPRKSITTGEGGILITNNKQIAETAQSLRNHGAIRTDLDRHTARDGFLLPEYPGVGYNYRLTDLAAAVGVAQFKKLTKILRRKREIAKRYDKELGTLPFFQTPAIPKNYEHGYQSYVGLFQPENVAEILQNKKNFLRRVDKLHQQRNQFMRKLDDAGVATRQGTHCVSIQKYYAQKYKLKPIELPRSFIADRLSISLPIYPALTDKQVSYIIARFTEIGKSVCVA